MVMSRSSISSEVSTTAIDVPPQGSETVIIDVFGLYPDGSRQVPPAETTIDCEASFGEIVGPDAFIVPSTNAPGAFTVSVTWVAPDEPGTGILSCTITTPGETVSGTPNISITSS